TSIRGRGNEADDTGRATNKLIAAPVIKAARLMPIGSTPRFWLCPSSRYIAVKNAIAIEQRRIPIVLFDRDQLWLAASAFASSQRLSTWMFARWFRTAASASA